MSKTYALIFVRKSKINIIHLMRNALDNFNNISQLRSTKKPSLNKLGFLVDHSHSTPISQPFL